MKRKLSAYEVEFDLLYNFLDEKLPESFNSKRKDDEIFGVGDEVDSDLYASFLMLADEYNSNIPIAIQNYLKTLKFNWTVVGTFAITFWISEEKGLAYPLVTEPSFTVTKQNIIGYTDMNELKKNWGERLITLKN